MSQEDHLNRNIPQLYCFNCLDVLSTVENSVSCGDCQAHLYCSKECKEEEKENGSHELCHTSSAVVRLHSGLYPKLTTCYSARAGQIIHLGVERRHALVDEEGNIDPLELWPDCKNKKAFCCYGGCSPCDAAKELDETEAFKYYASKYVSPLFTNAFMTVADRGVVSLIKAIVSTPTDNILCNAFYVFMRKNNKIVFAIVATRDIRKGQFIFAYDGQDAITNGRLNFTCYKLLQVYDPFMFIAALDCRARKLFREFEECRTKCAKSLLIQKRFDEDSIVVMLIYKYILALNESTEIRSFNHLVPFLLEVNPR